MWMVYSHADQAGDRRHRGGDPEGDARRRPGMIRGWLLSGFMATLQSPTPPTCTRRLGSVREAWSGRWHRCAREPASAAGASWVAVSTSGPTCRSATTSRLQNYALVYDPARLESGVFIGPAVVLTNDLYPRSVEPDGSLKSSADWSPLGVVVREGASVGARAVVVAGCTIGRWALVAAGSTVTRDVADFALVAGSPARRIKWVGRAGEPLEDQGSGVWRCPRTGSLYRED